MKKLVLVLLVSTLGLSNVNAQLSELSRNLKNASPEVYNPIKALAKDKWLNNHEMVVFTINNQVESWKEIFFVVVNSENYDDSVLTDAMIKWKVILNSGVEDVFDWEMVLFTYKNQMKNKDY